MTKRIFYFLLAWVFFGIGFIGMFVPILPTTIFMILALWSFSKSSDRFHHWLYTHKLFGPSLQLWTEHRVIPVIAKSFSVLFMTISIVYLYFFADVPVWILIMATIIVVYASWFILSKPSQAPSR